VTPRRRNGRGLPPLLPRRATGGGAALGLKGETASRTVMLARISLFTSFAVAGSFIQLPSPVSSVALDSVSGYFVAMNFGEVEGASVLFAGHLATAVVHGFPLGVLHFPIAAGLALQGVIMARVSRAFGRLASTCVGVAINTALTAVVIPFLGVGAAITFLPFIFVASLINGGVAYVVSGSLARAGLMERIRGAGIRR